MTTPTPAVSPSVPYYAELQPYITVDEFLAAPTGVDSSQLIPSGDTDANTAALATLIRSASNYADSLCYQVLGATVDLEQGEYRVGRDGCIRVPVPYTPVIAVLGVSTGYTPTGLTPITDLSGTWFGPKVIRIPAGASYCGRGTSGRLFAQITYVNGYANTTLAADVSQGATSVQVVSPLGIFPGVPLTLYDDAAGTTEPVTVGTTYAQGSTTVPLAAPLNNLHTSGAALSAMPRAIKQAVIALTTHLVKTRGAEAITFASISGGPQSMEKQLPGGDEEYDQAVDLLHPFRRVA